MPTVRVKENEPFEVALRRFKRTVEKTGLLTELRAREFYEKPTAYRKRKLAAAVKRHYKRLGRAGSSLSGLAFSDSPVFNSRSQVLIPAMSVKAKITDDMKAAMKAREVQRLSAIRLLLAAIQQREVDERKELSDAEVASVIEKMIKQRRDSIAQFQAAGRQDLVEKETFELNLLSGYLPKQLTDAEIGSEIAAAIVQTGAKGAADMGKVMGLLKGKLSGRADMGRVSALVKAKLSG